MNWANLFSRKNQSFDARTQQTNELFVKAVSEVFYDEFRKILGEKYLTDDEYFSKMDNDSARKVLESKYTGDSALDKFEKISDEDKASLMIALTKMYCDKNSVVFYEGKTLKREMEIDPINLGKAIANNIATKEFNEEYIDHMMEMFSLAKDPSQGLSAKDFFSGLKDFKIVKLDMNNPEHKDPIEEFVKMLIEDEKLKNKKCPYFLETIFKIVSEIGNDKTGKLDAKEVFFELVKGTTIHNNIELDSIPGNKGIRGGGDKEAKFYNEITAECLSNLASKILGRSVAGKAGGS